MEVDDAVSVGVLRHSKPPTAPRSFAKPCAAFRRNASDARKLAKHEASSAVGSRIAVRLLQRNVRRRYMPYLMRHSLRRARSALRMLSRVERTRTWSTCFRKGIITWKIEPPHNEAVFLLGEFDLGRPAAPAPKPPAVKCLDEAISWPA